MSDNGKIVRVFKCPCDGNKFKLAGEPKENPTPSEKKQYGEFISMGCTVVNITLDEFIQENWEWCDKKKH